MAKHSEHLPSMYQREKHARHGQHAIKQMIKYFRYIQSVDEAARLVRDQASSNIFKGHTGCEWVKVR
jgi:hypothetical protein